MPKYEYVCKSCAQHLEVVQSFADDALTECPACGGRLRKVFGDIGIAFKGSGFYRTDNRKRRQESKSEAAETGGDTKTDTKSEAKGDSKGDSKSEAKGDSKPEPAKKESAPSSGAKPKTTEAKTA